MVSVIMLVAVTVVVMTVTVVVMTVTMMMVTVVMMVMSRGCGYFHVAVLFVTMLVGSFKLKRGVA